MPSPADSVDDEPVTTAPPGETGARRRRWLPDAAGIASVVAMAIAYLSPALKDGGRFGSFDFVIPLTGLGKGAYPAPAFNHLNSDVVSQMNAWNLYDYQQVHAGHFPLWNDLSLLGLPHFLNFESAVLSLPDLVSYLVPLAYAFLVAVLVKLLIAGLGAYLLARVLRLSPLGAGFAGITYMLSGAFANWLSWPLSDVVAWLGPIAAFAVLSWRYPGRLRHVAGLAASVAFCAFGGFPEANVFVAVSLAVLAAVLGVAAGLRRLQGRQGSGRYLVRLGQVAGGGLLGVVLALPLWWPGLQLLSGAHRSTEGGFPGLPARSLALVVAAGYDGLPTGKNPFFLAGSNYYESVAYLGVVALVLAAVGLVVHRRRPGVLALGALAVVAVLISYQLRGFHPVQSVLNHLAGEVQWERFRTVLGLPVGLLGGLGLETVLRLRRSRPALVTFAATTLAAGLVVVVLATRRVSPAAAEQVRSRSLYWPAALVLGCLVVAATWAVVARRAGTGRHGRGAPQRAAAAVLFGANAGFLLFAGVGINAYSHTLYPVTPAIAELRHDVGGALVGLDDGNTTNAQQFAPVGFYPEVNLGYGIAEFAGHDPVLPQQYFATLTPGAGSGGPGFFEPDIDSVRLARLYGTPYVLALASAPPLRGARLVAVIGGERLWSVPGVSRFTLPGGRVRLVAHPEPEEYDLATSSAHAGTLTIRITDVVGWHASIDGRPAQLLGANGVMWSLAVPAGSHRIRLWYLPRRFVEGLDAAGAGLVVFAAVCAGAAVVRRRRRQGGGRPSRVAADQFDLWVEPVPPGASP